MRLSRELRAWLCSDRMLEELMSAISVFIVSGLLCFGLVLSVSCTNFITDPSPLRDEILWRLHERGAEAVEEYLQQQVAAGKLTATRADRIRRQLQLLEEELQERLQASPQPAATTAPTP